VKNYNTGKLGNSDELDSKDVKEKEETIEIFKKFDEEAEKDHTITISKYDNVRHEEHFKITTPSQKNCAISFAY
jgi:hypothetical protein